MGNTQQKQEASLAKTDEDKSGEEESSTFTCEICIEPILSVKKFKNNDECFHPFCADCFAKYIQVKVEDNVASIQCPALDCNHLLDPLICQTIISVELFHKWCDLLCDSSLLALDRCYCPYQNCSALVINECGGTVKKSTCPNCKKLFCYTCQVPWHAGYWCAETQQRRDANDVTFGVLLEKFQWSRCPKCGQAIELIAGCRNVECRCGNHFCHKCGESIHFGPCDQPGQCCCNCCGNCCWFFIITTILSLLIWFLVNHLKH